MSVTRRGGTADRRASAELASGRGPHVCLALAVSVAACYARTQTQDTKAQDAKVQDAKVQDAKIQDARAHDERRHDDDDDDAAAHDARAHDARAHDATAHDATLHGDARAEGGTTGPTGVDVLTHHNNVARTGENLSETVLTTSNVNVNSFGKLFSLPVQGQVYAQPLVVTNVAVGGKMRDVLIVATMHNVVYAFDANLGGAPLWEVTLGPTVPAADLIPTGDAAVHAMWTTLNIQPEAGILSTPVIDRDNGYIYLAREDFTGGVQSFKVHVLSLATGQDEPGSPTTVAASVPGTPADGGSLTFSAVHQAQRPGLLLLNGTVYLGFGSHDDNFPFAGWVLGYTYNAAAGSLAQTHVFNVTPDGNGGGIWASGQGLVTDGQSIYVATGNGTSSAWSGGSSYAQSFIKLSPDLEVLDWFMPYNYADLTEIDYDLGSAGPVLIPDTSPQLITGGGKEGVVYVVDTTNMGHLGTVDNMGTQFFQATTHLIFSSPVIWSAGGTRMYVWGNGDVPHAYSFKNGAFDTSAIATGPVTSTGAAGPACMSLSSNGATAGTGILWASVPLQNPTAKTVAGMLYALDALTLTELWTSADNASRDGVGNYAKMSLPTVANGKVYLGTFSQQVLVYGLLPTDGGVAVKDGGVEAGSRTEGGVEAGADR